MFRPFAYPICRITLAGVILATFTACDEGLAIERSCAEIVGGHPDGDHRAVVALVDGWGDLVCSGAWVGSSGARSFVLTAAHCLDEAVVGVVMGEDLRSPSGAWPVVDRLAHPAFDPDTGDFDFAVVIVDGSLDAAAPLALATPDRDKLAPGDGLEFIGYGETLVPDDNSLRTTVTGSIEALTSTTVTYRQDVGGPCTGDSGGPTLARIDGDELIVGVTSFGDAQCNSTGTSGRVSVGYDFIHSVIQDKGTDCRSATVP